MTFCWFSLQPPTVFAKVHKKNNKGSIRYISAPLQWLYGSLKNEGWVSGWGWAVFQSASTRWVLCSQWKAWPRDTAPLPSLPPWPRQASHWDSCPPCNGTVASSPVAFAPAAGVGEKPDSLFLASAASAVSLLVSVLLVVCAYIPTQSRKEQRRGHVTPGTHIRTLSSSKACRGGEMELKTNNSRDKESPK